MRCPKCGRELTPASLHILETILSGHLCFGCNHLFMRLDSARPGADRDDGRREAVGGRDAPAVECCPLSTEIETEVKKLFGE
ncbi:MAG: hypothetical protein ACM3ZC_00275 [Bacteroidota bacterium]